MTNKEKVKIVNLISELDIAVERLLLPAKYDSLLDDIKIQVSRVSFELSNMME